MREFRGKLEAVKDATVVGWAYGAGSDDPHVRFRLKINDKDSGVHVADQFREDLRRKQIGDGHHGFRIPVAAELFQPGENLIEVFAEPEAIKIGATLVYSHAVAPAPTPKPVMRGKLERVRGDHIVGWLFDPEAPARHVAFELRVNGEPAGHFVAAEMRDDLIAAKMGAGDHAFRIPLPTERLVVGDNVLEIRLTPDGPPIGSPLVHGYTPPPPKPVPPPAPKPVLRGKLERVRGDHVIGWLFDPDAPARHVAFELLVNGEPVGSFLAGDARDDLIAARMGDGDHAFRVPLPTDRLAAGDNVLEIRLAPDGPVIDKPLVHTYTPPPPKPAPKPALRGKLERIRGDRVIGWLFDSTRPNLHLGFDLVINGESAGAYTAAEMRDDLVAAGMGQGDHAFSVDLPKDRLVAGDNLVAIRLSEDGQFIDRPLTHTHVPPQPKPAVRGKLERIKGDRVIGWLFDAIRPEEHVAFDLMLNGETAGRFIADELRDDLIAAQMGAGDHAFAIELPKNRLIAGDNQVAICLAADGRIIDRSLTYTYTPPKPVPTVRGKLERVKGGQVQGWLFDTTEPSRHLAFELLVNGESAGVFTADLPRSDLQSADLGDGDHAFAVDLPADLKAGDNRVEIRLASDGQVIDKPLIYKYTPKPALKPAGKSAPPRPKPVSRPDSERQAPTWPRYAEVRYRGKPDTGKPTLTPDGVGSLVTAMLARSDLNEKDVFALVEQQAKLQNWQLVLMFCDGLPDDFAISHRILTWQGRAALYLGDLAQAAHLFEQVYDLDPRKHGSIFYLGVVYARQARWQDAANIFEICVDLEPAKEAKYYLELGRALIRIGFGSYGVFGEDRSVLPRAVEMIEKALAIDPGNIGARRELTTLYLHLLRYDEALDMAESAVERAPRDLGARIELTRVHVRLNNIAAALEASTAALAIAPDNDTCKFNHRVISRLADTAQSRSDDPVVFGEALDVTDGWGPAILAASSRWLRLGAETAQALSEALALVSAIGYDWAAGVRVAPGRIVWRRDYLVSLFEAGILDDRSTCEQIEHAAALHARISEREVKMRPDLSPTLVNGRTVLLFSQYGVRKFGGGEHFLQQMGQIYRAMGYDVLVIGTQADMVGEEGEVDGLRYRFIEKSPQAFVRLVFDEKPVLAHMISGLAFEVTTAFRFFKVSLIHGIHFWRDMLAPPTPSTGYYPDVDIDDPESRVEFNGVIRDSEVVYANSHYTRRMVEATYGLRPPIIFSLPDNVAPDETGDIVPDGRDFVLLANARADKGFDIFIEAAKRLPHIRFCAIASQSSRDVAVAELERAGVSNVELLDHVADMTTLYRQARVVAVPSYRFVETFSRVVIEAQRFGVPVIGSDTGNVPCLLTEAGTSLPEDADLWAGEIVRLFDDDGYWRERSRLALENSERYSFDMQAPRLRRLVAAVDKPVLIGVGSGLGNIIHTAPMVRNIARRTGRPVDIVMAGDHKDMLFVLSQTEYVNHAFVLNDDVLNRRYDTVFLTHSFGTAIPHFATNRLLQSRQWKSFNPGGDLHETEFNLAAAQAMLGVDYEPDDVHQYFLGDYVYEKPKDILVGLHAGSKGGIWGAKRWPGYGALAQRLMARGIRVASFGTPDEYVEGTENRTGGTIEEMTRAMLSCSHFVANDSGVMNVANALGIPLVALFAPTNVRTRGPLGADSRSIVIARDCAPCELDTSKDSKFTNATCDCIGGITVDEVLKALEL